MVKCHTVKLNLVKSNESNHLKYEEAYQSIGCG